MRKAKAACDSRMMDIRRQRTDALHNPEDPAARLISEIGRGHAGQAGSAGSAAQAAPDHVGLQQTRTCSDGLPAQPASDAALGQQAEMTVGVAGMRCQASGRDASLAAALQDVAAQTGETPDSVDAHRDAKRPEAATPRPVRTKAGPSDRADAGSAAGFGLPALMSAVLDVEATLSLRLSQRPPAGDWRTWLILGGRGSGKTRAGAEWAHAMASHAAEPVRIALIAETLADAREVMVDGVSGIWRIARRARPAFEVTRRRLVWPNGSVAQLFSSEDPESLRGPQFDFAWADDLGFMISYTDFSEQGWDREMEGNLREQKLSYACAILSVTFGACFIWNAGFPPRAPLADGNWFFAALMVFFFAFPFAQKLEVARIVKFEAKSEKEPSRRSND